MFKGIAYAIGACGIWGLIFIVPQFMEGFSAIEIAIGRYLFYGLVSSLILLRSGFKGLVRYPWSIWKKALGFSLLSSIVYYSFVVFALRYSTPAICALVLGVSPITISFYGNWKEKEHHFKSLLIPSFLILSGLAIINTPQIMQTPSPSTYMLGLICAFWALLIWSWFAVANAGFLKNHPEVASNDWSTLIGVSSLLWVMVLSGILCFCFAEHFEVEKYFIYSESLRGFLVGSAILGLLCSWVGFFLWNRASCYLPVSLAGQLMIFETVFGLLFFYLIDRNIPSTEEVIGISLFLIAIVYGIRSSSKLSEEKGKAISS